MKKLATLLGIGAFLVLAACGGQEAADGDEIMDDQMEPSSEMMEEHPDSMVADSMEEGMPEGMMDEDEGMMDEGEGAMDEGSSGGS